jgi:hypothetical protein
MTENEPKPDRQGRRYGGPLARKLAAEAQQAATPPLLPEQALTPLPIDIDPLPHLGNLDVPDTRAGRSYKTAKEAFEARLKELKGVDLATNEPLPVPVSYTFTFPDGVTLKTSFDLNDQQKAALENMAEWASNPNIPTYALIGYAGTGKTTIMRLLVEYLVRHKFKPLVLAAPTHRAKSVLTKSAGKYVSKEDCMTLHAMLKLKPTFDMENLDLKNLDFNKEGDDKIPDGGFVIVDEASMLNDGLCVVLESLCQSREAKLLFVGDPAQLKPVKQDTVSIAFNTKFRSELTQVMRQSNGNPISFLLEAIRNNQLQTTDSYQRFNRLSSNDQGIRFTTQATEVRSWISKHILSERARTDFNYIRILCGTNKMVQLYNLSVRNVLYGDDADEYIKGELITGYSNYGSDAAFQPLIVNSADYVVREVLPTERELIPGLYVRGYFLTLVDADSDRAIDRRHGKQIFIINRHEPMETYGILGQHLNQLQREARSKAKLKQRGAWDEFHFFKNSFCTSVDYKHGDYTLLRKALDYGYALTVHKSQGGTYAHVMVDEDDIEGAFIEDHQLRHQLKYVAFSRASEQVLCYTKRKIVRPKLF